MKLQPLHEARQVGVMQFDGFYVPNDPGLQLHGSLYLKDPGHQRINTKELSVISGKLHNTTFNDRGLNEDFAQEIENSVGDDLVVLKHDTNNLKWIEINHKDWEFYSHS